MDYENNEEYIYSDTDTEEDSDLVTFLKENFTVQDFLNFKDTREILERQHRENFEKNCFPKLESFYKNEVDLWKREQSLLFVNENGYRNLGCFIESVYSCIEPDYDLTVFYDNPVLAKNMVESYEERIKIGEEELKKKRLEEIMKEENIMKNYDWKNKKYK